MIQPPQEVPQDAIVTAAQWLALAEYMRAVYAYLPKTVHLSATCQYGVTSQTASFSGSTAYWASSAVPYIGVSVSVYSGNNSGFAGQGLNLASSNGQPLCVPYIGSGTSATMPTSTVYYGRARWPACQTDFEGRWMQNA